MPYYVLEAWREYSYRSWCPMTHEQFLDEPAATVKWMVRLRELVSELEEERMKKALA